MKRLSAVVAALALSFGIASCGGYEQVDVSALDGVPTGSIRFASSEAANMNITIGATTYTGPALGGGTCQDDLAFSSLGCTALDGTNGTATVTNLCIGDWTFSSIAIYPQSDATCTGSALANCEDVSGPAFTVVPGTNTVFLLCDVAGASVTFDVALQ